MIREGLSYYPAATAIILLPTCIALIVTESSGVGDVSSYFSSGSY